MPDSKPSAPLSGVVDDPANIPSPKLGVPSTGNLVADSFRSAVHIGEVPCARNSLLAGIARVSAPPVVAGSWAVFTWALVSSLPLHSTFCIKKLEDQQRLTRVAIEKLPKQLQLKKEDEKEPSST
ncbi:hypothetical protein B0H14DRAFT_2910166 [Mycena olivaceomarginata]|nr:hypothetical protein B0H14DRAFT_2910166 [Mycena olivaceomarginata]